jgi:multidrug efflux pump subunit AcrA (membrane-fusion protein)
MTLVGKIFTVLILIMSIVFMAFSMMVFATHKNWKDAAVGKGGLQEKLNAANTALKDAKDALEREKMDLAREQAARKAALASLQVRAAQSDNRAALKQKELEDLTAAHSKATEVAKVAQDRLADLEVETGNLRNTLRTERQRLDKMFLNVVDLTDKLNQAESLRQNLEEVNRQATQQMTQMKMVLDRNGLTPDSLIAHIPPKVEGVVLEVSDKDLIEISIGADDGLKIGHSLDVYRSNSYLGRIVIKKTDPDRSVGQIKKELQRGQIKRGDRVTTKFS